MSILLGRYENGNYHVAIFNDGTKIRYNHEDSLVPDRPECMDVKITNYCDMNCPMCHENSSCHGQHGRILGLSFYKTLQPYTEIAIGGGNPLSHPDLIPFLEELKSYKLIPNITVNQKHFMDNLDFLQELTKKKLIYGLGVSVTRVDDEFFAAIAKFPNLVIHVINGYTSVSTMRQLANRNLKILILGYKDFRRGSNYLDDNEYHIKQTQAVMYSLLPQMKEEQWYNTISFDNLAIRQLNIARLMPEEEWNKFYMGDDGKFTMYIDLVNQEFARSSVSIERYPLMDNIKDMFEMV